MNLTCSTLNLLAFWNCPCLAVLLFLSRVESVQEWVWTEGVKRKWNCAHATCIGQTLFK